MESEERPTKMRKLSHERDSETVPNAVTNSTGTSVESDEPQEQKASHVGDAVVKKASLSSDPPVIKQEREPSEDDEEELPPPEEFAPLSNSDEVITDGPVMSKNQIKKLRKKEEWESKRGERKAVRKEKLVQKRERKRAARNEMSIDAPRPRVKQVYQKPVQLPVTILVDCDFDDLMRDNERISLGAQITRCYSDNKNNAAEEARKWMCDLPNAGELSGTFKPLSSDDADKIKALKEEGEVVYLSSEASETLTELKPYSTYIIGGLVDKNREKGICYKRATRKGVRTAKLPIGEYLQMSSRKVLATNHVNEIMMKWLESGDWADAFMKVIPKRKGGQLKGQAEQEDEQDDNEDEEEADGSEEGGVEKTANEAAPNTATAEQDDGVLVEADAEWSLVDVTS
ncbi:tRNA (guanine(9)-N(1))-methyltransferase [Elasticomyces elasticus]|nr:tRNA (guanine(9)-N(1))-methyltransferase [Elasticomyces elasticus]KAK3643531.1 tRNA (guanine(9)-N(1))-methyltransferase [Elasticomyces elasticus]KAK4915039.1 tRNA (guanine(9)-N(1))-methyltransferase [Elasticomyces elasticus]KAK5751110.1 tRNA (guanine(9)-N(1))-methyltransferase [Elasticomyces elasticus]